MAKMTQKEALCRGLVACGYEQDLDALTRKYMVYRHPDRGVAMLVGRSAALRWVPTGAPISQSHSLSGTRSRRAYIEIGERYDAWSSSEQARAEYTHLTKKSK